ncbi:PREDICTED: kinetochore protein Spc24-like [Dinoponera quadriceps]|uniref:Kinetochore protein Spc24-like n=1 Tax=Dinoponera quadriceps TaxID=609295 RepID=A0A6P3XFQ4_DINQU|nr:PREDICTED: kinetochore protein Spc24-like [Dinoponera quadriceps]
MCCSISNFNVCQCLRLSDVSSVSERLNAIVAMEEVEQLKAKYMRVDTSKLKDLLLSQAGIVDKIRKSQDQQCHEDEIKIKELTSKLATMKETLNMEAETLENENSELAKHNLYLEKLEVEKMKFSQEIKQLEAQRNNLKTKLANPNLQDQQMLEQGKRKLRIYRKLTKIQWDYEASKHSIQGYVTNGCDYIHHFCYGNQEVNEKLVDSLWHEIYLSTGESSEVTNENLQPNIPAISL